MSDIKNIKKIYNEWVDKICDGQITKKLVSMTQSDIIDSFSGDLEFGTAGMRGVMGYGSNRMNEITVTRVACAVCRYVKENFENPSIVIGFDTRNNSKKFSRVFARYATSQGIKTYLFKNYCPTPVLTFSIKNLRTSMGVMITASHNNKTYNGIKVSDHNGIQISGDVQQKLTAYYNESNGISLYNKIYNINLTKTKLVENVGKQIYDEFLTYGNVDKKNRKIKVVYTPLNGTGYNCVKKLLNKNNFKIYVPKSQKKASGEFLTCPYPNPEFEDAFCESKKLAQKVDADIIVATDPDADRIGVMVKCDEGYYKLSGNEVGYIFLDQKCKQTKDKNAFAVASVVTSPLATDISKHYNVTIHRGLTGFKNLGKIMHDQIKEHGEDAYVLAYEESCGYILRNDIYDKDGVFACLEICKIADDLKNQNSSLYSYLQKIYDNFGFLANINASVVFEGNDAKQKMQQSVENLRKNPPKTLKNEEIIQKIDYLMDNTGLEKQNFIELRSQNITAIIRPSGTEPKLKFYIFAKSNDMKKSESIASEVYDEIKEFVLKGE